MSYQIDDAWPLTSGAATFAEIRRSLNGLVRAPGVLSGTTPLLAATNTMNVQVNPFVAAFMRDVPTNLATPSAWGVALGQNSAAAMLGGMSAPSSQNRLYTVYAKADDGALGEDGLTVLDVVASNDAASPTKADPPVGGVELGTVLIPSGATSLQSTGVVITNRARRAIVHGARLAVNDAAHRDFILLSSGTNRGPYTTDAAGYRALQDSGLQVWRQDLGAYEYFTAAYDATNNPSGQGSVASWHRLVPVRVSQSIAPPAKNTPTTVGTIQWVLFGAVQIPVGATRAIVTYYLTNLTAPTSANNTNVQMQFGGGVTGQSLRLAGSGSGVSFNTSYVDDLDISSLAAGATVTPQINATFNAGSGSYGVTSDTRASITIEFR